jgi:uncharacterized membrane protein
MRGSVIAGALAIGAVAWFALVVLAPDLPAALAAAVYAAGSLVCHQMPDRSFYRHGAQLAVCARCTGIYLGACSAVLLVPLPPSVYMRWSSHPARIGRLLGAAAIPAIATVVAEQAGWWQPSSIVRAATGVALGAAGVLVVVAAVRRDASRSR